jgi:hypothetical protein
MSENFKTVSCQGKSLTAASIAGNTGLETLAVDRK